MTKRVMRLPKSSPVCSMQAELFHRAFASSHSEEAVESEVIDYGSDIAKGDLEWMGQDDPNSNGAAIPGIHPHFEPINEQIDWPIQGVLWNVRHRRNF